jgi:hypothetical protein
MASVAVIHHPRCGSTSRAGSTVACGADSSASHDRTHTDSSLRYLPRYTGVSSSFSASQPQRVPPRLSRTCISGGSTDPARWHGGCQGKGLCDGVVRGRGTSSATRWAMAKRLPCTGFRFAAPARTSRGRLVQSYSAPTLRELRILDCVLDAPCPPPPQHGDAPFDDLSASATPRQSWADWNSLLNARETEKNTRKQRVTSFCCTARLSKDACRVFRSGRARSASDSFEG